MPHEKDKIYLHALNLTEEWNFQKSAKLFGALGSFEKIWSASKKELSFFFGRSEDALNKFTKSRDKINPEKEWNKLQEKEITFLSFPEQEYPQELKETPWPPFGIYIKGKLKKKYTKSIYCRYQTRH